MHTQYRATADRANMANSDCVENLEAWSVSAIPDPRAGQSALRSDGIGPHASAHFMSYLGRSIPRCLAASLPFDCVPGKSKDRRILSLSIIPAFPSDERSPFAVASGPSSPWLRFVVIPLPPFFSLPLPRLGSYPLLFRIASSPQHSFSTAAIAPANAAFEVQIEAGN
jgi:hypothetical protein